MANQKKKPSSKPSRDDDGLNSYARLTGITFELLALNLGIIAGGYYLGEWVGTNFPWVLILAIFLSVAATIFYLLQKFNH